MYWLIVGAVAAVLVYAVVRLQMNERANRRRDWQDHMRRLNKDAVEDVARLYKLISRAYGPPKEFYERELDEAMEELEFLRTLPDDDRWLTELELKIRAREKEVESSRVILGQQTVGGWRIMWEGVIERQEAEIDHLKSFRGNAKKAREIMSWTSRDSRGAPWMLT